MEHQYAIVIVGAGPAGCACALRLHLQGQHNIALLDAGTTRDFQIGESIQPDANRLLRELGIYDEFVQQGHEPAYGTRSFWGNHRVGYNDNLLNPFGHGWHLDRTRFNTFLQQKVKDAGIPIFAQHQFIAAQAQGEGLLLSVKAPDGEVQPLSARFVVDASGVRSVVAKSQQASIVEAPPLACLAMRFAATRVDKIPQVTHLESVPYGWWYVTRIPEQQLLVTLYTEAESVKRRRLNQAPAWLHHVQDTMHTAAYLAPAAPQPLDTRLLGFPVRSFCRQHVVGQHWLAIGDAAMTYDPITSQGILKALGQGILAADALVAHGKGKTDALSAYQHELHQAYHHYLEVRKHFYGLETRWAEHPFWQRMQHPDMYPPLPSRGNGA